MLEERDRRRPHLNLNKVGLAAEVKDMTSQLSSYVLYMLYPQRFKLCLAYANVTSEVDSSSVHPRGQ